MQRLLIMLIGFQFGGVGEAAFPNFLKATRWKIMKNLETANLCLCKLRSAMLIPLFQKMLSLSNAPQKV